MSYKSLKIDAEMWIKLAALADQERDKPWQQIASEMGMGLLEARKLMVALQDAQQDLLSRTGETHDIFQVMNWTKWCQLTHLLEDLVKQEELKDLRPMLVSVLKEHRHHPAYPVYAQLRSRYQSSSAKNKPHVLTKEEGFTEHKVHLIEEALLEKDTIVVECTGKLLSLIPCKLVYLEGELSLIAEEVHDHSLLSLALVEVTNIKKAEKSKSHRASSHEINEFIAALRSMSDNELRLVLKIKNPDQFALIPDYQFLGRPALVTNQEGDLIWAAWVEPCDEIYDWLLTMEEHVEILEPSEFVLDFAAYCEEKSRKLA